jgi:hypothetical protein
LVPVARNLNSPFPPATPPKIRFLPILIRNGPAPGGAATAHQVDHSINSNHDRPPTKIILGRKGSDYDVPIT